MAAPGFQYFTSADSGAPVLYGAAGRMIAVLDWVLVTKGGWAKAFTGTNLAAYRSATGNRFYLRVDDTLAQHARMRGYRTMTAVSTGTLPFPNLAYIPLAGWGLTKSGTADTTARKYWGIRTNRYVMLVVEPVNPLGGFEGAAPRNIFLFGDVPSYCETDPFNTIIFGQDHSATIGFPFSYNMTNIVLTSISSTFSGPHMAANPSGTAAACSTAMSCDAAMVGQTYAAADAAYLKAGRLQYRDFVIYSSETIPPTGGIGILRTYLPNIKVGFGVIPNIHLAEGNTVTVGSRSYIPLASQVYDPSSDGGQSYASGFFLLETTDTDGML